VGPKHFQNAARREWWSIHIEAWQRSGLSQRRYCAQHRLTETTFTRWRKALGAAKAQQIKAEILLEERRERRRKRRIRLSTGMRSKAVQAFWAMHVEAMTWCGMSALAYAKAHGLSEHSLRRWRNLLDAGEVQIDWRAHLHPSALPQISTSASSAAKESDVENGLTNEPIADSGRDGRAHRRSFTDEEKLAIVLECEQPGNSVSAIARAHRLATSALFRWRADLGYGRNAKAQLAPVVLPVEQSTGQTTADPATFMLRDLLPVPEGMTAIDLPDGRGLFVPGGSDPNTVRRYVAEPKTS
jgi:transposase-like protein